METLNNKCLIIGNGPSVNSIDFDKLRKTNITTLCCNRIDLLIKDKKWYPDYYFCFKSNIDNNWKDSIKYVTQHKNIKCFLSPEFKSFIKESSNITFVKNLYEHDRHSSIPDNLFETTFNKFQFKSYSATVPIFQYCFSNNIKTLGIIGQDGYIFSNGKNHFNKTYGYEASNFEKTNIRIQTLYKIIAKHCKKNNINLYNLSNKSVIDSCTFLEFNKFIDI